MGDRRGDGNCADLDPTCDPHRVDKRQQACSKYGVTHVELHAASRPRLAPTKAFRHFARKQISRVVTSTGRSSRR